MVQGVCHGEFKFAKKGVVFSVCMLTLVHLDEHSGLVVGVCVMLDKHSHDTISGLNIQRQGSNIEEVEILCVFLDMSPERMEAWTVAPYATASSGLMLLIFKSWRTFSTSSRVPQKRS